MLNIVALMGRLTHTPELKTTQNGTSVCSFSIAVDRTYTQKGEERKADFIDIVAWRQTAEFICKYFQKGSMIAIDGSIQTRSYQDKQGSNRTKVEVLANNVSFCGSKAADKPAVCDFDQQTEVTLPKRNPLTAPPQAAQNFSQGSADDFAEITDDGDLPF